MLNRLFSYSGHDQLDDLEYQFYDCTLNTQIGGVIKGTEVDCIIVDFCSGDLTLFPESGERKFKLRLKVA